MKIRQNTVYEEKLSKHLVLASEEKKADWLQFENEHKPKKKAKETWAKVPTEEAVDPAQVKSKLFDKKLLHSLCTKSVSKLADEGKLKIAGNFPELYRKNFSLKESISYMDQEL